jgi:RuvB-like protein 2
MVCSFCIWREKRGPRLMKMQDVQTIGRIDLHSHITGLGATDGTVEYNKDGLVAQIKARRAMLTVKKLVEGNKGGRIVLLKGEGGTGKTALSIGLARSLGDVRFNTLNGTEVYSLEMSKCEALVQALRKAVGLKIRETAKVIEGEVVALASNRVVLKTVDMESEFEIGEKMRGEFDREKVSCGDVIKIVRERGRVYKIGTSSVRKNEMVGTDTRFVPCPEGELLKVKDEVQEISLHDVDVINNRTQGYLALFSGETGEIKAEIRDEVNKKVWGWVNEGKAEITRGVLFIDEVHMLDIECFAFLNKAVEEDFCPVIVLSSNRRESVIRGTDEAGPYGMPRDFLNRALVVSTDRYLREDLDAIMRHRIFEEDIGIEEAAAEELVSISESSGLRYAMNLLTISGIRAAKRSSRVTLSDVKRVYELFLDEQRGIKKLNH